MNERFSVFLARNILLPVLRPVSWLTQELYSLFFGWLDVRASKEKERRLELEIRELLPFLFGSQEATVVPNVGIPFPEPFDYATVTVACRNLLIRFSRGRSDLKVDLAGSNDPSNWHDLLLVLAAIDGREERPERRWFFDLREAAILLESNMARLSGVFGSNENSEVERRLEEFERADRVSMREWEYRVNNRLR
jgi:hypothetical protein